MLEDNLTQSPPLDAPYDWHEDEVQMHKAVRAAGAVVMSHYKSSALKKWRKSDKSHLTEADIAANDILKKILCEDYQCDYGWLSEETEDDETAKAKRLNAKRVWVVDPIDGTRSFVQGRPEFTICAALICNEGHKGQVLCAAVFNPATDEFFHASLGHGAFCNGEPIKCSDHTALANCKMLASTMIFKHPGWPNPWPRMDIDQRNSTNYRVCLIAKGEFDATLALLPKADWDSAPSALIAKESGAIITDHMGNDLCFNQENPSQLSLVCASKFVYPRLYARLSHLKEDIWAQTNQLVNKLPRQSAAIETKIRDKTMQDNFEYSQILYLVIGGEVENFEEAKFKNPEDIELVGVFWDKAKAENVWRSKAQESVDNAHMRYFVAPLHELLDPNHDGKFGPFG